MRLAIVHREKCKPTVCGRECKKYCPVEKKESDSCVVIGSAARGIPSIEGTKVPPSSGKCVIDEKSCVGCAICVKRCPLGAIDIVNLPSVSEEDLVYRYGANGFALYGLPIPKVGKVLGLLGRNGIGKSTAVKILSGNIEIDVGKFKGSELQKYFDLLGDKKVSYKPQNLSVLAKDIGVMELLENRGDKKEIRELAKKLNVENILGNRMDKLSGGELQRVAILAASLGDADIYFFDEPLAFLDIGERLRVSDFIKEIGRDKTVIVVEHDLLVLDYLTDYLNVFYGAQGVFGTVSGVKSSREGVNAYLKGFLKEENLLIRDKELNFNFTKNASVSGGKIGEWPDFNLRFDSGFELNVKGGEIRENHVIGILGKNGTGKTSFVRALVGELDENCSCDVEISERLGGKKNSTRTNTDKHGLDLGLDISYKSQYLFSESEEFVRDIVFREKINKKLSSVFNLGVLVGKKLRELSGGELQRFSVARCLAKDADVYFLDEPSAYLDVEERILVAKAIKDVMVERGKTAFVVEHDLLLVSYLADLIINFSEVGSRMDGESKGSRMNTNEHELKKRVGVCEASEVRNFEDGVGELLKSLDITLRKDKESGRPRINKRGSVLDREQKLKNHWAIF
ncbi:MAG: ribosome biogenesis/translation initiation ATPase RLI [archaeon]